MAVSRRQCCAGLLGGLGAAFLAACRSGRPRRASASGFSLDGGVALLGTVWPGGAAEPAAGWVVLLDDRGRIDRMGAVAEVTVPVGVRRIGGPDTWIGPGIVDAHVHLAFGPAEEGLRGGLVGVRDLGAPPAIAARSRSRGTALPTGRPVVAVAGPLLTAPGGYPSTTWGRDGFTRAVDSPEAARAAVRALVADGVDLVKIALEPAGGLPVPGPGQVRAVVDAAHAAGLAVTAHALSAEMVTRALDAGVDELCHVPDEPLDAALIERIAASGVPVVSTIQTFFSGGSGGAVAANAAALVAIGVPLVYGTDLGNAGTRPGVDPRELDRLADAGLGRLGALRAATVGAAGLLGDSRVTGALVAGSAPALVVLSADPLREPSVWRSPLLVLVGGQGTAPDPSALAAITR